MSDEGATNNFSQCEGHVKIMKFCHRVRAIFLSHVTAWFETVIDYKEASQRPSFHNDWQPQKVYYEVTSRPFESARAAKRLNVELHPSVCANWSTLHSHTEAAHAAHRCGSLGRLKEITEDASPQQQPRSSSSAALPQELHLLPRNLRKKVEAIRQQHKTHTVCIRRGTWPSA